MSQVLWQFGVQDHVFLIFGIRIHVCTSWGDSPKLNHQGIFLSSCLKMPQGWSIAACAVPVLQRSRLTTTLVIISSINSIILRIYLSVKSNTPPGKLINYIFSNKLLTGLPEPICPVERLSQRFSVTPVSSHFHCSILYKKANFEYIESTSSIILNIRNKYTKLGEDRPRCADQSSSLKTAKYVENPSSPAWDP